MTPEAAANLARIQTSYEFQLTRERNLQHAYLKSLQEFQEANARLDRQNKYYAAQLDRANSKISQLEDEVIAYMKEADKQAESGRLAKISSYHETIARFAYIIAIENELGSEALDQVKSVLLETEEWIKNEGVFTVDVHVELMKRCYEKRNADSLIADWDEALCSCNGS